MAVVRKISEVAIGIVGKLNSTIRSSIASISGLSVASIISTGLKMWLGFTKAEVIGAELVKNGDFATDTSSWTAARFSLSSVNSQCVATFSGNEANAMFQANAFIVGNTYKLVFWAKSDTLTSGLNAAYLGVVQTIKSQMVSPTLQKWELICKPQQTSLQLSFTPTASTVNIIIDSVSVKEITQSITDKSTNSNNAKLFTGKALSFNGNDVVSLGSGLDGFSIATISISFYATGNYGMLLGRDGAWNPSLQLVTTQNKFILRGIGDFVWSGGISLNNWYRLVITRTSAGLHTMYLNDIEADNTITLVSPKLNFNQIGVQNNTSAFWQGMISDVQFYDKVWVSDDVTYDYNNPNNLVIDNEYSSITNANLIGYWALSEGSGSIAFDSAGLSGELVVNGDFATDSNWTRGLGWSIGGGVATSTVTARHSYLQQIGNYDSGKTYRVTFDIVVTSGNFKVAFIGGGSDFGATITASEIGYSVDITLSGNRSAFGVRNNDGNGVGSISNMSLREITDNKGAIYDGSVIGATWVDKQPFIPQIGIQNWSKGSNYFNNSNPEYASQGFNYSSNVVFSLSDEAPQNLQVKSRKLTSIARTTSMRGAGSSAMTLPVFNKGDIITITCVVKSDGLVEFWLGGYFGNENAKFSLLDGSLTSSQINVLFTTSEDVGGGWYKFSVTYTFQDAINNHYLYAGIGSLNSNYNPLDGINGLLFSKFQIEIASSTGNYIATNRMAAIDATLIQNPNDIGKDVLGNSLRLREGGFNLDGSGYAEVADDSTIQVGNTLSLGFWVKPLITSNSAQNLIYKDSWFNGYGVYLINNNKIRLYLDGTHDTSDMTLTIGSWNYVSITYDGSSIKFYLNGSINGSPIAKTATVNSSGHNLFIGSNESLSERYDGIIDEILIYDTPLTATEILNNYNVGLPTHS